MTDQPSLPMAHLALGYGRRVDLLEEHAPGATEPIVRYVEALRAERGRLAEALAAVHPDAGTQTAEPEPAPAPWAARVSQAVAAAQARAPRPTPATVAAQGGMPGIGR